MKKVLIVVGIFTSAMSILYLMVIRAATTSGNIAIEPSEYIDPKHVIYDDLESFNQQHLLFNEMETANIFSCPETSPSNLVASHNYTFDIAWTQPDDQFSPALNVLEGPVWLEDRFYFTRYGIGGITKLYTYSPLDDKVSEVLNNHGGNGMAIYDTDKLLLANFKQAALTIFDPNEPTTPQQNLVESYNDKPFNSPNDIIIASNGMIYFTDPSWQTVNGEAQGEERAYQYNPTTKAVTAIAPDGPSRPNGITLSNNEEVLYVSGFDGLHAYNIDNDVVNQTSTKIRSGELDGMGRDCAGNIYVTDSSGDVHIYSQDDNTLIRTLNLPEDIQAANIAFGGIDGKTMLITTIGTSGKKALLYKATSPVAGYPY